MFALSLVDTLRLTFGQVVYRHKAHTRAARTFLRLSRWFRVGEALFLVAVVIATVGAAAGRGPLFSLVAAVIAGATLVIFLVHMMFDFDASARAHHACGTSLWHVREQVRALLSDLTDEAIDPEGGRLRRNALMNELHAIYQSAPPIAGQVHAKSDGPGEVADEAALADEQIDRFLPKSLHAARKPAGAAGR
jgi:hypothetical protein